MPFKSKEVVKYKERESDWTTDKAKPNRSLFFLSSKKTAGMM